MDKKLIAVAFGTFLATEQFTLRRAHRHYSKQINKLNQEKTLLGMRSDLYMEAIEALRNDEMDEEVWKNLTERATFINMMYEEVD